MNMPEKMLRGLLSGLGVKPEDVINGLNFVIGETTAIKADREAYKAGVQAFMPIVSAFMKTTEHRLDTLEELLRDIQSRMPPRAITHVQAEPLINGATHDE